MEEGKMKNNIVMKICSSMLLIVLLGGLVACGNKEIDEEILVNEHKESNQITEMEQSENTEDMVLNEVDEGETANVEREAYIVALRKIYDEHVLPDGKELESAWDFSENEFAIYDIDLDGREELIFKYITTAVAGMTEFIYDYDEESGKLRQQFVEFPGLTFYENGNIEAGWSHNQGLAGDFWPYTMYQYNREADNYTAVGSVDAWDKSFWRTDYAGEPFPEEIDVDKDGIVYFLLVDGNYGYENPVDSKEYNKWHDTYTGGVEPIEVPFLNLTEENMEDIKDKTNFVSQRDTTISPNHHYELVIADVTWEEAASLCKNKGGHLATITSDEEFEKIETQIAEEAKNGTVFWVGANRVEGTYYRWIEDDNLNGNEITEWWLKGEPSYSGTTEDGQVVEEMCVSLLYKKAEGRYYLNDVPNDILSAAPSYKGNIGYICEYDE